MRATIEQDGHKGVLIVEDETIVARNLKIIVEKLGYRVSGIAPSGKSALDAMEQSGDNTSLVLMDITLAGTMDGIETADRICSNSGPTLVYVTGNNDRATIEKARARTSPYAIIKKPFNVGLLESTIQGALEPVQCKDAAHAQEKRAACRIQALPYPWEKAYITVDDDVQPAMLINISQRGVGILYDAVLHTHIKYPINLQLCEPWKQVRGLASIGRVVHGEQSIYYGLKISFNDTNRLLWEEYVQHRLDTRAH